MLDPQDSRSPPPEGFEFIRAPNGTILITNVQHTGNGIRRRSVWTSYVLIVPERPVRREAAKYGRVYT